MYKAGQAMNDNNIIIDLYNKKQTRVIQSMATLNLYKVIKELQQNKDLKNNAKKYID